MAFESSLTTHPGHMAAEACALMAHVIVRAITREPAQSTSLAFLDMYVRMYVCMGVYLCMLCKINTHYCVVCDSNLPI